jgi:2-hydroxymuconate-semialdehyde hydrolase
MQEQGKYEMINGINTYYHEAGEGEPLLLIHGSGPGVSAWANWRLIIPILSKKYHLYAPDLVGFGSTQKLNGTSYGVEVWVNHLISFIEAKNLKSLSIVGNSLGGCLALHIANRRPDLLNKIILMGASGIDFKLTEGLEAVWGYTPSLENMKKLIQVFSYDTKHANNADLVQMRYQATLEGESQAAFESMFPHPRQQHIDAMALSEEEFRKIEVPTLLLHGREDRVVPIDETSWRIANIMPNAELHTFPKCGHWTQIEKTDAFCKQVEYFLG